jgi:hypothetical protein
VVENGEEGRAFCHDGEAAEKGRRRRLLPLQTLAPRGHLCGDQPGPDVGSAYPRFGRRDGFSGSCLLRAEALQFVSRLARRFLQPLILRLSRPRFGERPSRARLQRFSRRLRRTDRRDRGKQR